MTDLLPRPEMKGENTLHKRTDKERKWSEPVIDNRRGVPPTPKPREGRRGVVGCVFMGKRRWRKGVTLKTI